MRFKVAPEIKQTKKNLCISKSCILQFPFLSINQSLKIFPDTPKILIPLLFYIRAKK